MLGNDVEQFSFLPVKASAQPVAHRAAGVANYSAWSATTNSVLAKYTVHGELEGDTGNLAAVALHLKLDMIPQFSLSLAFLLSALIGVVAPFALGEESCLSLRELLRRPRPILHFAVILRIGKEPSPPGVHIFYLDFFRSHRTRRKTNPTPSVISPMDCIAFCQKDSSFSTSTDTFCGTGTFR